MADKDKKPETNSDSEEDSLCKYLHTYYNFRGLDLPHGKNIN